MSFGIEIIADDSGKFAGNAVRLATRKEAEEYGARLAQDWILVQQHRVIESSDSVNCAFRDGRVIWVAS